MSQSRSLIFPNVGCTPNVCYSAKASINSHSSARSRVPFPRRRSSSALLDLRTRRHSRRPLQRRPQRDPLDECSLQQASGRAGIFFSHAHAERIVEMAHHLGRRHASPLRLGVRVQPLDAFAGKRRGPSDRQVCSLLVILTQSTVNAILDHQKQRTAGSRTTGAPGFTGHFERGSAVRPQAAQRPRGGAPPSDPLQHRERRLSRSAGTRLAGTAPGQRAVRPAAAVSSGMASSISYWPRCCNPPAVRTTSPKKCCTGWNTWFIRFPTSAF